MKERILVVDDEEIVRTGLAQDLEGKGYRVATAASAEEAIETLGRMDVDLLLCDLVMEGMDGMQLLKTVHADNPALPVVVITGYGTMDSAIEALRLGASDYIQKPAGPEEVTHRIETVLNTVRLRGSVQMERRIAEEKKRELYDRLVRAQRMVSLGTLAEGMAYELNNILAPVVSYPGLILEALPADHAVRHYVEAIEEAGKTATEMIHDLQTIGRGGDIQRLPVSLNDVIESYLGSPEFDQVIRRHGGVRIDKRLEGGLPPVAGSRNQLTRVVANLLVNAVEAMPSGGRLSILSSVAHVEEPSGLFESGQEGDYVVMIVEDTGVGLSRTEMERIFEPFYTRKEAKRKRMSGLGLPLVYRLVKDHQGYINVTSQEGKGTRFMVYLPVPDATVPAAEEKSTDYAGCETILVVDDYEDQRKVAAALLESLGYKVLTAESGHVAVKVFEDMAPQRDPHPIDLVVLDMILADDFDGLETYKRIVQINPDQKCIIVSGFAETERIVQARKLGAGSYVQKPYSLDALGKAVRSELDKDS